MYQPKDTKACTVTEPIYIYLIGNCKQLSNCISRDYWENIKETMDFSLKKSYHTSSNLGFVLSFCFVLWLTWKLMLASYTETKGFIWIPVSLSPFG
ncbi:hypothetical protein LENED_000378 [Lentinula edodes]|uniref:Uncharacterized protein n=1 Tax=Lentinula edodes TaxID=5353 RepID=A0A1Q3DVL6_LENED|nr:hypothetical protein LENED_000378 [Lentinula edodes]